MSQESIFYSYTNGKGIFFKYTVKKGVQWRRDIIPAVHKVLLSNNIKVGKTNMLLEQVWWTFDWETSEQPKFVYNEELKEFIDAKDLNKPETPKLIKLQVKYNNLRSLHNSLTKISKKIYNLESQPDLQELYNKFVETGATLQDLLNKRMIETQMQVKSLNQNN